MNYQKTNDWLGKDMSVFFFQSPETISRSQKEWKTKKNSPMKRDNAKDSLVELVGLGPGNSLPDVSWNTCTQSTYSPLNLHSENCSLDHRRSWTKVSFRLTGRDADLGATWMSISGTYVYVPLSSTWRVTAFKTLQNRTNNFQSLKEKNYIK